LLTSILYVFSVTRSFRTSGAFWIGFCDCCEKPCPADGVAAVAVRDTDTVGLVVCPSETAELNMNHIRQEQQFRSRIPYGGVHLLYSEDERVFSIVLRFETLQARNEAVMNLSFRRTRGTQQDSTAVKLFEGMSFINPNDESGRYKIVSLNRNDVTCVNKTTKVEHVFNRSDVMAWIMSSLHGTN
jgi:hypothetical protein